MDVVVRFMAGTVAGSCTCADQFLLTIHAGDRIIGKLCDKCGGSKVQIENERRLRDMICPQCEKDFELSWNDWSDKPETLRIRSCPSGGIYDVRIKCPHCDYEEEL